MGKGDKKTRRGKINSGSYGKTRLRKSSKPIVVSEKREVTEEPPKAKKTRKAKD